LFTLTITDTYQNQTFFNIKEVLINTDKGVALFGAKEVPTILPFNKQLIFTICPQDEYVAQ